jgi:hypothetical protein
VKDLAILLSPKEMSKNKPPCNIGMALVEGCAETVVTKKPKLRSRPNLISKAISKASSVVRSSAYGFQGVLKLLETDSNPLFAMAYKSVANAGTLNETKYSVEIPKTQIKISSRDKSVYSCRLRANACSPTIFLMTADGMQSVFDVPTYLVEKLRTSEHSGFTTGFHASIARDDEEGWIDTTIPVIQLEKDAATDVLDLKPLVMVVPREDQQTLASVNDHEGWVEKSKQFLIHDTQLERLVEKPKPVVGEPEYRATYDAFREIPEMDIHKAALGEALNSITTMPSAFAVHIKKSASSDEEDGGDSKFESVEKVFKGKYKGDFTDFPVNARGNLKPLARVLRFGTSNGLHYSADDQTQELAAFATRYACQQKQFLLDEEGRVLSRKIARNGFDSMIDVEKLADAWSDVKMSDVYNGWLKKARTAGYSSAHCLSAEEDDRVLRFSGKGNFKAKEDAVTWNSVAKCSQGIMAWSKGANSFFGYACRMISEVIKASLNESTVWNNGMSMDDVAQKFIKATLKVPVPENVRLDAVEMDSKQNEFTHAINMEFDRLLGVDSDFLELYYSLYADYRVINNNVEAKLQWVKPSGAPWTLKGNTMLMLNLCLWLIEGDGAMALFGQGDDVDRNQANMRINDSRMSELGLYCGFDMSMEWGDFAAFCGFVLCHGQLVPNIRRKLIKLSGMSFKSVKHFEEVQIGVREYTRELRSLLSFDDIIQINADTYGKSKADVYDWFDCIESIGHISALQFSSAVSRIDMNTKFLAQGSEGKYNRLETVY